MMRNKFLLLPLITLILGACSSSSSTEKSSSSSGEVLPKKANVIILCGQSNAEGNTWNKMLMEKDKDLFDKYFESNTSKTKIKYRSNAKSGSTSTESKTFTSIRLGMGCDFDRFGPEIGMNEVFEVADLSEDLFIIKYASGGTNLQYEWLSPSSSSSTLPVGVLYNGIVDYVKESLNQLEEMNYLPYIKGICWMQGESDGRYAKRYKANEYNFISDLRKEFAYYLEEGDRKIKFISAGISSYWENYTIINESKKENADLDLDNNYFIDTNKANLSYDKEPTAGIDYCHYDSLAMVELGKLFAEAMMSFNILK